MSFTPLLANFFSQLLKTIGTPCQEHYGITTTGVRTSKLRTNARRRPSDQHCAHW